MSIKCFKEWYRNKIQQKGLFYLGDDSSKNLHFLSADQLFCFNFLISSSPNWCVEFVVESESIVDLSLLLKLSTIKSLNIMMKVKCQQGCYINPQWNFQLLQRIAPPHNSLGHILMYKTGKVKRDTEMMGAKSTLLSVSWVMSWLKSLHLRRLKKSWATGLIIYMDVKINGPVVWGVVN